MTPLLCSPLQSLKICSWEFLRSKLLGDPIRAKGRLAKICPFILHRYKWFLGQWQSRLCVTQCESSLCHAHVLPQLYVFIYFNMYQSTCHISAFHTDRYVVIIFENAKSPWKFWPVVRFPPTSSVRCGPHSPQSLVTLHDTAHSVFVTFYKQKMSTESIESKREWLPMFFSHPFTWNKRSIYKEV